MYSYMYNIYIYIYICIRPRHRGGGRGPGHHRDQRAHGGDEERQGDGRPHGERAGQAHRWIGNPRPQPQAFSKLVILIDLVNLACV